MRVLEYLNGYQRLPIPSYVLFLFSTCAIFLGLSIDIGIRLDAARVAGQGSGICIWKGRKGTRWYETEL